MELVCAYSFKRLAPSVDSSVDHWEPVALSVYWSIIPSASIPPALYLSINSTRNSIIRKGIHAEVDL